MFSMKKIFHKCKLKYFLILTKKTFFHDERMQPKVSNAEKSSTILM